MVLVKWYDFTRWILEKVDSFPKNQRFVFGTRLAESTKGRVFFTAGKDLDRYVVWDYVSRRREIVN